MKSLSKRTKSGSDKMTPKTREAWIVMECLGVMQIIRESCGLQPTGSWIALTWKVRPFSITKWVLRGVSMKIIGA